LKKQQTNNKTTIMKTKITLTIVGLLFVAGLVSSCGAGGKAGCDAYGQAKIKQNADLASK
jgi:hypothetical protein